MDILLQFIPAVMVLMIVPGTDMAYCIAAGISNGNKGALFAAVGIGCGGLVLAVFTATIVFLVADANLGAFALLQVAGSFYLLYLGIKILTSKKTSGAGESIKFMGKRIFLRGVITNISNPKALVFFISFIPQFIPTDAEHPYWLALFLGVVLCVIGTPINFLFGLSGVSLKILNAKKIANRPLSDWITATVFMVIAVIFLGNYIKGFA